MNRPKLVVWQLPARYDTSTEAENIIEILYQATTGEDITNKEILEREADYVNS